MKRYASPFFVANFVRFNSPGHGAFFLDCLKCIAPCGQSLNFVCSDRPANNVHLAIDTTLVYRKQ